MAVACVDILTFVPPPMSSKVYKVCESSGPERDLNPYFWFGSYSVTSKVPWIRCPMKWPMLRKNVPTPNAALRSLRGFQSPILPLKIIFRCADEIEDLLDGPVDEFG